MSQKKPEKDQLKSTLSELDFAIEQWERLTSKPAGEQVCRDEELQEKTKNLLQELRDQIEEFDMIPPTSESLKLEVSRLLDTEGS